MPSQLPASEIIARMVDRKLHLAIAESLTGGLLTSAFVDVPGASKVLLGSIVAYQSELKHELLGVSRVLLATQGAVDPEVAAQMAIGVRARLAQKMGLNEAQVIGLATTGVAGPESQDGKPAGQVFVAVSMSDGDFVYPLTLSGGRDEVRKSAVSEALGLLGEHFE